MLSEKRNSKIRSKRRALSVRRRLRRDDMAPRLSVFRSSKHIYAQVIDDEKGVTLAASSTASKTLSSELGGKNKTQRAALVGSEVARLAKEKGVERVVFDRGPNKYHGRVKALADAAREGGLVF